MQITSIKSEDRKKKRFGIDLDKSRHFGSSDCPINRRIIRANDKTMIAYNQELGNNLEI